MFIIFLDSVCKILHRAKKETCVFLFDIDLQMWFKIRRNSDVWFTVRPAYALSECAFWFRQGSLNVSWSCDALRMPSSAASQKYWGQDTRSVSLISASQDFLCCLKPFSHFLRKSSVAHCTAIYDFNLLHMDCQYGLSIRTAYGLSIRTAYGLYMDCPYGLHMDCPCGLLMDCP